MGTWNWLDFALVAVVVVSTGLAAIKGLVRELISLAAVVVALIIASWGYGRAAAWFEDLTRSHEVALGAGFLSLFIGTLLAGLIVSALARRLVKKGELRRADFFLGAVFGLIRGLVVDCILLMALVAFAIKPLAVEQSRLAPYVTTGARAIALLMPRELKDQFRTGLDKVKQAIIQGDKKTSGN